MLVHNVWSISLTISGNSLITRVSKEKAKTHKPSTGIMSFSFECESKDEHDIHNACSQCYIRNTEFEKCLRIITNITNIASYSIYIDIPRYYSTLNTRSELVQMAN